MMLHVPIPDNLEFRQRLINLGHLGIRNVDIDRVLVDAFNRGGSRDGDDVWVPGPLGQVPGPGDGQLGRVVPLLLGQLPDMVGELLVVLKVPWAEAGKELQQRVFGDVGVGLELVGEELGRVSSLIGSGEEK